MNLMLWLMRAKRWARNPPSARQVALVFVVVAICLAIVAVEVFVGWPAWLTLNRLSAKP